MNIIKYDDKSSTKCVDSSANICCHSTDVAPVKWAGDMKTALCPSPPSCGDTPAEGFSGRGSASPWISPLTLSCWCRDGRQWILPRSRRWSPRAGDKWGWGTVGGQQKWDGWVCLCVCACLQDNKTTKLHILMREIFTAHKVQFVEGNPNHSSTEDLEHNVWSSEAPKKKTLSDSCSNLWNVYGAFCIWTQGE